MQKIFGLNRTMIFKIYFCDFVIQTTEEQLTRVVSDLFVAGSETTASTLLWLILYMVTYPDVQDRVHQELDDVLKMEAQPLLSHRPALPFLRAVICETQRYADILPIGAPHAASKAFELHGYHIPQGAILLPFLHGVHFHPSWGDPDVFRPSRFLDDDLAGREMLLPFSTGESHVTTGGICIQLSRHSTGASMAKEDAFHNTKNQLNNFIVADFVRVWNTMNSIKVNIFRITGYNY